ncbi:MAG: hypothetical protein ACXVCP_05805 [Bdellovibrio sp.]
MKTVIFFFLLAVLGLAFWGCPTRRNIPDPIPPQPKVVKWQLDDTPGYLGREPYVGPKIQFERMLA